MSVENRKRKLTYDDLVKMPEDGKRHEIIDGRHYVSAALRRIEIYRQAGSGFGPVSELSTAAADTLATPLLPGLSLPLRKIFPPIAGGSARLG
jgi:hypothetical protein